MKRLYRMEYLMEQHISKKGTKDNKSCIHKDSG